MNSQAFSRFLTGIVSVASVVVACSSDDTGGNPASGPDASGGSGSGGSGSSGGAGGSASASSAGTGGASAADSGGGGVLADAGDGSAAPVCDGGFADPETHECRTLEEATAECIAESLVEVPGRRIDREDCDVGCFCTKCLETYVYCGVDEGCKAIMKCAADTGCDGLSCAAPEYCGDVLTQVGGFFSESAQLAIAFNDCREVQGCAIDCVDGGTGDAGHDSGPDGSAADGG